MPLIDPDYLRRSALARINVGMLPAVPSDYDTKLEPDEEQAFQAWKAANAPNDTGEDYDLRGAWKAGLSKDADTGHMADTFKKPNHPTFSDQSQYAIGNDAPKAGHWAEDNATFIPPAGLLGQDSLDQGAADRLNVGMLPAVPMMGRGPRPPGAEPDRQFLMEDKWQPPVTDAQDWVSGQFDKIPAIASDTVAKMMPGPVSQIPYLNQLTSPLSMVQGMAEQGAQLTDTGTEIARGQQISHPALAAFNAITMAPIPGARVAKEAEQGVQAAKPFFSMLRQAVEAAPFSKAPGKQWLGRVQNTPGVKLDELDWTGFKKWAEATPLATKEQALAHLDDNAIDVQEVWKGGTSKPKIVMENGGFVVRDGDGNVVGRHANAAAASKQADEIANKSGATKFSDYQLPGGENYREMLLTLPEKKRSPQGFEAEAELKTKGFGVGEEADGSTFLYSLSDHQPVKQMTPELKGLLDAAGVANDELPPLPSNFQSGHYDEPNILAHMRFNDRVDANGKKTLFIEEIQSDWHQKGRKQGYQASPSQEREKQDALAAYHAANRDRVSRGVREPDEAERAAWARVEGGFHGTDEGVPDAPFKKDWHELALKRAIKYAADNGYDQIAWTPGAVQAERYDLSKHVDNISAVRGAKEGTYDFTAKLKQGGDIAKQGLTEAELADEIGKDMAEKIVKDMHELKNNRWGVRNSQSGNWSPRFATKEEAEAYQRDLPEGTRKQTEVLPMTEKFSKIYRDLDLKVGGEGMQGFYDKMLPDAANKIGKKYGAKTGTTKITTEAKGSAGGIASNGKEFWVPLPNGEKSPKFDSYIKADDWRSDYLHGKNEVWTLPITPQLKEQAVKKGFPVSALEDLTRAVG